jgi:hypothetical protein
MSGWSRHNNGQRWRGCCLLLASLLVACGHQDGIVGAQPLGAAGQTSLGFVDEFTPTSAIWEPQTTLPGASTSVGDANQAARDGYLAELHFPGHPEYGPKQQVGAQFVTQLATNERFHFGTYRTRLSFGSCDPGEETVMAFLGYFNDGTDHDGDGIVDDLEIDMQVACGTPSNLFLTVFTDDEEPPQGTRFRKLSHVVDFSSGDAFETQATDSEAYASVGNDPFLLAPELLAPDALYELGFEWHTDSIRFFLVLNGAERDLWTLTGAERVPQLPVQIMYNLWHPDTHWYPAEGSADFPANDVVMRVDWVSFEPE